MQKIVYFLFLGILITIFSSFSGCQKKEKYIDGLKASAIYPTFQKQGFQLDSGENYIVGMFTNLLRKYRHTIFLYWEILIMKYLR